MLDTDPVPLQRGRTLQPGGGPDRPRQADQPAEGAAGQSGEGHQRGEGIAREGIGRVQNENSHLRFRGDFRIMLVVWVSSLLT